MAREEQIKAELLQLIESSTDYERMERVLQEFKSPEPAWELTPEQEAALEEADKSADIPWEEFLERVQASKAERGRQAV